jgi:hypothetical protein
MGWSSGSGLFDDVIEAVKEHVPDDAARKNIYAKLIGAFEEHDWDTEEECLGKDPMFDAALRERHPGLYDGD